ncbi:hypothetical protein BK136_09915 [Paenibacillus amylolyticus]|nr:hypothetical protein BK136_09915 [Paenibacillus amylolyticus]
MHNISTNETRLSSLMELLSCILRGIKLSKTFEVDSYWNIPDKPGIIVSVDNNGMKFVSHSHDMRKRLTQIRSEKYTNDIVRYKYVEVKRYDERLSVRNAMKVLIDLCENKKNGITPIVK